MPERGFSTEYWADTFVETLPAEGKLLYAYLWTNPHCNQAGLYEITLNRIAYETKLPADSLPSLIQSLETKVKWYPEQNLVWVKNFVKRQSKSPKFLAAAAKSLVSIHDNGAIEELLTYNRERYSISIPYRYYIDRVSIHTNSDLICTVSSSRSEEVRVVKGKGELGVAEVTPPSESEIDESLSEGDREVISVWRSVKGFDLPAGEAAALVARLRTEFGELDILAESKSWAARKLSEPLTRMSRPSSQIWNWVRKAREFAQERELGRGKLASAKKREGDWGESPHYFKPRG